MKLAKRNSEPIFLLNGVGVVLSIILFPIGIFILLFATIKYLADWMCYNFNMPRPLCWLSAILLGPFFLPLVVISFFYETMSGDDSYSVRRESLTKEEKVLSSKKSKRKSMK